MAMQLFNLAYCTGGAPAAQICPENFILKPAEDCDPHSKCSCGSVKATCESYLGVTSCYCTAHEKPGDDCPDTMCELEEKEVKKVEVKETPLQAVMKDGKGGSVLFSHQYCTLGATASSVCPGGYRMNPSDRCDVNSKCSCGSVVAICEKVGSTTDCHCTGLETVGEFCPAEICPINAEDVKRNRAKKANKQRQTTETTAKPDEPTGTPDNTPKPDEPTGTPDNTPEPFSAAGISELATGGAGSVSYSKALSLVSLLAVAAAQLFVR